MKKLLFILSLFALALTACGQNADQIFNVPPKFNAGFYLNGVLYTTMPTGTGTADWNTLLNKPVLFNGQYSSLTGVPNFNSLYRPITWKPDYKTEVLNTPVEIELSDAIEALGYLPIPAKTTAEINAIVVPAGKSGIIKDKTLNVYKLWDGVSWGKIVITSQ